MPELPEAEIAGRQLHRWLSDTPVERVEVRDPGAVRKVLTSKPSMKVDDAQGALDALIGASPERPVRHGKRLGWPWGAHGLLVHLGMSGKFVRRPADQVEPYARVGWFAGDHVVWFVDRRRFGCFVVVPRGELQAGLREGHGPDALDAPLDSEGLKSTLTGRRAIKVALMDQAKLAGIGNIQAAEALFRAGVSPKTACKDVTDAQWQRLSSAIPEQLQYVIDAEDAGEIVYMTEGTRENPFAVYGREGESCGTCGVSIEMLTQSGRSTFFCPGCQR